MEVRLDDGALDEVVADGFHLERLDKGVWWMRVDGIGGRSVTVTLTARGAINAEFETEGKVRRVPVSGQ